MVEMDKTNQQVAKKCGLFAYAPNLPTSVRIVALLLFIFGVLLVLPGLVMVWAGLTGYSSSLIPAVGLILIGTFFLILWNGLVRLKKWAFYLSVLLIVVGFPIGLLFFIFIFLNRKKFS